MASYCCTCAAPLSAGIPITPAIPGEPKTSSTTTTASTDTKSQPHRQLPCCDRFVCSRCLTKNPRFATYCPYCQIATAPPPTTKTGKAAEADSSSKDLLPPGLKAPPPYRRFGVGAVSDAPQTDDAPPPYSSPSTTTVTPTTASEKDTPVLHYLNHDRDTIASLSLRYNVPVDRIRQANRLTADHLLQARRVIQIPVSSATVSFSPEPVEDEGETRRKAAIRRFMVACKVADYDLAVLYLEQTAWRDGGGELEYDLRSAVESYLADERWEKAHPMEAAKRKAERQKKKSSGGGLGFFSQRRTDPPSL
ncbi:hypothetical protein SEUCBS139899_010071 [Sporothrix eucalyptigena]|uniref:LysM domain-containing protein n=1 Tax=Sporothrix eucalyptigena TaxID=1812306 RepID=A0ABP0BVM7_9PEZI